MEKISTEFHTIGSLMLGAVLHTIAAMDAHGLLDYTLKALISGIILMGLKLLSDFLSRKFFPPIVESEKSAESKSDTTTTSDSKKP